VGRAGREREPRPPPPGSRRGGERRGERDDEPGERPEIREEQLPGLVRSGEAHADGDHGRERPAPVRDASHVTAGGLREDAPGTEGGRRRRGQGIAVITERIVDRIEGKEEPPGSRAVRREAAKFCRANGSPIRNDEWLGV